MIIRTAASAATTEDACRRLGGLQYQWDANARLRAAGEGGLTGSLSRRLYSIGVTGKMLLEMGEAFCAEGLENRARAEISEIWENLPYKVDVQLKSRHLIENVWSDVWECFREQMTPRVDQKHHERYRLPRKPSPDAPPRGCSPSCAICRRNREIDRLGRVLDVFALDTKHNLTRSVPAPSVQDHYSRASGRATNDTIKVEGQTTLFVPRRDFVSPELQNPEPATQRRATSEE